MKFFEFILCILLTISPIHGITVYENSHISKRSPKPYHSYIEFEDKRENGGYGYKFQVQGDHAEPVQVHYNQPNFEQKNPEEDETYNINYEQPSPYAHHSVYQPVKYEKPQQTNQGPQIILESSLGHIRHESKNKETYDSLQNIPEANLQPFPNLFFPNKEQVNHYSNSAPVQLSQLPIITKYVQVPVPVKYISMPVKEQIVPVVPSRGHIKYNQVLLNAAPSKNEPVIIMKPNIEMPSENSQVPVKYIMVPVQSSENTREKNTYQENIPKQVHYKPNQDQVQIQEHVTYQHNTPNQIQHSTKILYEEPTPKQIHHYKPNQDVVQIQEHGTYQQYPPNQIDHNIKNMYGEHIPIQIHNYKQNEDQVQQNPPNQIQHNQYIFQDISNEETHKIKQRIPLKEINKGKQHFGAKINQFPHKYKEEDLLKNTEDNYRELLPNRLAHPKPEKLVYHHKHVQPLVEGQPMYEYKTIQEEDYKNQKPNIEYQMLHMPELVNKLPVNSLDLSHKFVPQAIPLRNEQNFVLPGNVHMNMNFGSMNHMQGVVDNNEQLKQFSSGFTPDLMQNINFNLGIKRRSLKRKENTKTNEMKIKLTQKEVNNN